MINDIKLKIQLQHREDSSDIIDITDYEINNNIVTFNFVESETELDDVQIFELDMELSEIGDCEVICYQKGSFEIESINFKYNEVYIVEDVIQHELVKFNVILPEDKQQYKQAIEDELSNEYNEWYWGEYRPIVTLI